MEKKVRKVTVQIFGETHIIRGTESEEHIRNVARNVDKRIAEISLKYPRMAMHHVALLAALNLADELETLREEHQTLLTMLGES